jgi:cytochrome c oxidase subunit II
MTALNLSAEGAQELSPGRLRKLRGSRVTLYARTSRIVRRFLPAVLFFCLGTSSWAAPATTNLWWMPDVASKHGVQVDQLFYFIYYLTGGVFVLTQVVYIYFLVKYRARKGVGAKYSHGNNQLEIVWTAIPTAIFIGLWAYSNHLWWNVIHSTPPDDAMEVAVVAYQFGWSMQYPGKDGRLGRSDVKLISNDNPFGNDKSDPATKDNFQSGVLELPVNKAVRIRLNSKDVIHGFYIPNFRIYQDAVPGRTIDWVWFVPTKIGTYDLACSQLCGQGHYNMKAQIQVVSQADFDKWYKEKATAALLERSSDKAYAQNK